MHIFFSYCSSQVPVRKVLSDYELMEFFKFALKNGFNTKSFKSEYWEEFLAILDVSVIIIIILIRIRS